MPSDRPLPEGFRGVSAEDAHPLALAAVREPKNPQSGLLTALKQPLKQDDPRVSAEVGSLSAMFASALTPSEVAFFEKPKAPVDENAKSRQSSPPRTFLHAHLVIIDILLMDPGISMTKLAHDTGYSRNWLHKVMGSDAFQAKVAERQAAIINPIIHSAIKDRISGLTSRSLEILEERMESDEVSTASALEIFTTMSKALGLGQQKAPPPVVQSFVVHVPPQMKDPNAWAALHSGRPVETLAEPLTIIPEGEDNAPE